MIHSSLKRCYLCGKTQQTDTHRGEEQQWRDRKRRSLLYLCFEFLYECVTSENRLMAALGGVVRRQAIGERAKQVQL